MERKLYQLNQSQDIVNLQCKYTIFKKVMNIISSITIDYDIDLDIMRQAFDKVVERNDCLRIKFVKSKGEIMQYFEEPNEAKYDVPYYEFSTAEEENNFVEGIKKKAIKYMKGVVCEPYFVKNHEGKFMVFLKVCHLILDVYGINNIYKDLLEVYDALKNGKELPNEPSRYEDVVRKDLLTKNNEQFRKDNKEFFTKYFSEKERPYYAGLHTDKLPLWQKQLKKGRPTMKMFFINNQTNSAVYPIDKSVMDKVTEYSKEHGYSIANVMMYIFTLCESMLNGRIKNVVQLELCNCRGTMTEKRAGGTKAQSLCCYLTFDYDKTFDENMKNFVDNQMLLYRHIGFPDIEFENLLNKLYHKPLLDTYYSCTFSLIPYSQPKGVHFQVYSNGRFVLPSYIALMYDMEQNAIEMAYDYQTKIISDENVKAFHQNYVSLLNQVMDNPQIITKDLKVDY